MMSMLEHALEYATRGWAVFPAWGITNGVCDCGKPNCSSPGKHPIPRNGVKEASADAETVARWWRAYPNANIAIATGQPSGLVVLDVDVGGGKPGLESLVALEARHGDLPKSCTVRTGSKGLHIYMAAPNKPLRNSVGRIAEAIDLRAEGGYVIAPPSRHISGNTYRWESYDA